MTGSNDTFPQPIFVGGSARTGTTMIGRLIAAHPRYHRIEVEARFHSARGGLCDLLNDRTTIDRFVDACLGEWWARGIKDHSGLQRVLERESLEAALERFRSEFERERWEAGRRLVHAILDPAARRAGKPAWVDGTGANILEAPTLFRLFPSARFIHMIRDGRAVTASILRKRNTTDDLEQAFGHWASRVLKSDAALRRMPPEPVLTIFLDELTAHDREGNLRRLVEHLELDDEGAVRDYFERKVDADQAHVGAWRQRMAPEDARWVDREYRRLLGQLRRRGVTWVPVPERNLVAELSARLGRSSRPHDALAHRRPPA
jgi:hypothetical protein